MARGGLVTDAGNNKIRKISTTLGINQNAMSNFSVLVYPNPANSSITISSNEEIEKSMIQVTDISGKYIFSQKVQNLISHNINCASWVNGVYLITIYDSMQNSKTLRLIISK